MFASPPDISHHALASVNGLRVDVSAGCMNLDFCSQAQFAIFSTSDSRIERQEQRPGPADDRGSNGGLRQVCRRPGLRSRA
jgi:hypothetical protein